METWNTFANEIMLSLFWAAIAFAAFQTFQTARLGRVIDRKDALLRRRREQFGNLSRVLRMTEELGDFGVWQYCPAEQRQEWSRGLRDLFGVDNNEPFLEGDAETLLQANHIDLVALARKASRHDRIVSADLKVHGLDQTERFLQMRMVRMRHEQSGAPRIFAVFLDVTYLVEREERLQRSQRIALAEARHARDEANRDPLTGLANRRYVMNELDRMLSDQDDTCEPVSLVLFDVDHFKRVNDEHGHLTGDAVLKRIARIASEQAREGDIVGRIGGEEFVWIVTSADRNFVQVISERLRKAIALGSAMASVPPVTISIGCVTADQGDTGLSLFARADEALYEAKNSGRNAVRMAA
ncbi:GGDEF domain-containing protein [Erythrobacter sp. HA6-11]